MLHSTVNIPLTKVFVKNSYLGDRDGYTEAYWYGVTSVPARNFLCHVMLENGSNWYGLPLASLSVRESPEPKEFSEIQGYDCFSYDISMIRFDFLRDQSVLTKAGEGMYLFTIVSHDTEGNGTFSEYPEQMKTFVFIALNSGHVVAYPNNYIQWTNEALYKKVDFPEYKRLSEVYRSES